MLKWSKTLLYCIYHLRQKIETNQDEGRAFYHLTISPAAMRLQDQECNVENFGASLTFLQLYGWKVTDLASYYPFAKDSPTTSRVAG